MKNKAVLYLFLFWLPMTSFSQEFQSYNLQNMKIESIIDSFKDSNNLYTGMGASLNFLKEFESEMDSGMYLIIFKNYTGINSQQYSIERLETNDFNDTNFLQVNINNQIPIDSLEKIISIQPFNYFQIFDIPISGRSPKSIFHSSMFCIYFNKQMIFLINSFGNRYSTGLETFFTNSSNQEIELLYVQLHRYFKGIKLKAYLPRELR